MDSLKWWEAYNIPNKRLSSTSSAASEYHGNYIMARAVTWSAVFHGGSSSYDLNNSVKST
jgi:hypothetical protein